MSSIGQALAEKGRSLRGPLSGEHYSKVVCTGKQERTANNSRKKSGTDLWRLQGGLQGVGVVPGRSGATGPHNVAALAALNAASVSSQWEEHGGPAWLHNKDRNLFFAVNTGKTLWLDKKTGEHTEFHEGQEYDLSWRIEGSAQARGGKQAMKVVIADLHEAAAALKLDLSHIDRPAAYFATFGCCPTAAPAEVAAKGLHMRLLPRLAEFRGVWADDDLQEALKDSFVHLGFDSCEAAVVLLLGVRLVAAASHSARGIVTIHAGGEGSDSIIQFGSSEGVGEPTTLCVELEESPPGQSVVLLSGDVGLGCEEIATTAASWLSRGQCRSGCAALLERARSSGAEGPLVAVASRITWAPSSSSPKRPRTEASSSQVRCRHILVRHAACKQPFDKVRRKAVKRSSEEAEAILLKVLRELEAAGELSGPFASGAKASSVSAAFTAQVRAISECESSLKGGELAGDLGWLDPSKKHDKAPAPLAKVAVGLQVSQVSDIVATDLGLHILKRTA
mmetsp:Transcript_99610/g.319678  ORF Transcript_99610/g.319678 Transcript_99610/m.319678 type:complete len:507 (+) Transcript_99610:59-1579(+)